MIVLRIVVSQMKNIIWDFMARQKLEEESGVSFEMLNMVKRDMAWACIEKLFHIDGFYTAVFKVYKEGYFPCSWTGAYPLGKFVVM